MSGPDYTKADKALEKARSNLTEAEAAFDSAKAGRARVLAAWLQKQGLGEWAPSAHGASDTVEVYAGAARIALSHRAWSGNRPFQCVAYNWPLTSVAPTAYGATPAAALSELRAAVAASRRSARNFDTRRMLDAAAEWLDQTLGMGA